MGKGKPSQTAAKKGTVKDCEEEKFTENCHSFSMHESPCVDVVITQCLGHVANSSIRRHCHDLQEEGEGVSKTKQLSWSHPVIAYSMKVDP